MNARPSWGGGRKVVCSKNSCNFPYPGKAENIAVSPGGLCAVVTNTRGNGVETLVFQENDRNRLDRAYFSELDGISLAGKAPEYVSINSAGYMVLLNRETAITCQVIEDYDTRTCGFVNCRETCDESFKNASAVAILNEENHFLVSDEQEERVHLFSFDGKYLSSYPESRSDESALCGLTEVVTHPVDDLAALLYKEANTIVVLRRQGKVLQQEILLDRSAIPGLQAPVSADFAVNGDATNLFVAAEDSNKIIRVQHWPHRADVSYLANLPPEHDHSNPPDSAMGQCLLSSSVACTTRDSSADRICPSPFNYDPVIGGTVAGGLVLSFIICMIPVVYCVHKHTGGRSQSHSPNSAEMKNL